jgi:diguanylate cyclase (GGDEF)-like protein
MGQILDAAQEAIAPAERGWLHLVKLPNSRTSELAQMDLSDARIRKIEPPEHMAGPLRVISSGRSLLVADVQGEPQILRFLDREEERRTVRAAIIAPLILKREVFGALSLSAPTPSAFSEADLNLLTSFAVTATAAIYNAILYSEAHSLAKTDPLTGQLNRRTFFELGQRELDRFQRFGGPLSAIMLDVDGFKQVNDSKGHAAGDRVLLELAERCCRVIRHVDILGRYGGDEFALVLPQADQSMAREIAERIRSSIGGAPILTGAGPVSISVSMGIAQATEDTNELGALLSRADQALYESKRAGRDCIRVAK